MLSSGHSLKPLSSYSPLYFPVLQDDHFVFCFYVMKGGSETEVDSAFELSLNSPAAGGLLSSSFEWFPNRLWFREDGWRALKLKTCYSKCAICEFGLVLRLMALEFSCMALMTTAALARQGFGGLLLYRSGCCRSSHLSFAKFQKLCSLRTLIWTTCLGV